MVRISLFGILDFFIVICLLFEIYYLVLNRHLFFSSGFLPLLFQLATRNLQPVTRSTFLIIVHGIECWYYMYLTS